MSDVVLIDLFRAQTKDMKEYGMKSEAEFDVQYPTGFLNLDYINGQRIRVHDMNGHMFDYDSVGIVDGSINMVIGRSGCGKSTLIKQSAGNIIRPYPLSCIFEDSIEGGITSRRDEILTGIPGSQMRTKLLKRNAGISIETFYKSIKVIYDKKMERAGDFRYDTGLLDSSGNKIFKFQPTVYILDSLAMLMPEKLTQEEEMSGQMSNTAAAKMIANAMRRIIPLCKAANIIVFVVNHITTKIEINPYQHSKANNMYLKQDETCPGGVTPFYVANNIFRLDDNTKLSEDKDLGISGNHVLITMIKSRTNRAGSATDMIFNQDIGFDAILSLYIMLKDKGLVKGAGAYLYFDGHPEVKFSQRNFKSKLFESPELMQIFHGMCVETLHNMLTVIEEKTESDLARTQSFTDSLINSLANYA